MPSELDAIRQELAELRAKVDRKAKPKDRRRALQCRLNDDEMDLVQAAARNRGVCVADLVRVGLNTVIGTEFRIGRDTPEGLKRFTIRRKPDHFNDGKTDIVLRGKSIAREDAGRVAMQLTLQAQALMREHNAAALPPLASERSQPGMMSDAAAPNGKLR